MKVNNITVNLADLQPGDVILFHTDFNIKHLMSIVSQIIDSFTHDYRSHAAIVTFWLLAVAMFWYGVHRQKKLNKK